MTKANMPMVQITRKRLLIWIGLVIFISLWMFILGILVGRGLAPVSLAELKAKVLKQEQQRLEEQLKGQRGKKPELGFYEALKNPGKQETFKPTKPLARVEPRQPPPINRQDAPFATATAPNPTNALPSAPPAQPQPTFKPDTSKGKYTIQVASVKEPQSAEKLVADLRGKGYQAYQTRSEVGGGKGVWYRIRVGAYKERPMAEKVLGKLKGDKYKGLIVRTR